MAKGEQIPKTSPAEIEHLIKQIQQTNLDPNTKEKVERLLRTVLMLVQMLQRKNISIRKLKEMIFGPRTETWAGEKPEQQSASGESDVPNGTASDESGKTERELRGENSLVKGHGRRAADEYPGARQVKCRHTGYQAGDRCPEAMCKGRLYDLNEPKVLLQFTGQALIQATNYEQEVLRCASCQQRFVAPLPDGVSNERFTASADATIALMKYGAGLPFYRQSQIQEMTGVPLSESVMWERCEAVADAALGVYLQLKQRAANGEVIYTDDTRVRILSCLKEDTEQSGGGRSTNTSGMVVKVGERKIALYASGRRHAGENLEELLNKREPGLPKPIQMSDALAANWSSKEEVIGAKCLAHARRKVYELKEIYPTQCRVVLEAVSEVYRVESESEGMSADERLAWHHKQSGPVMEKLQEWIEAEFREHRVEPNSALGKALKYWRKHWRELTTFLREAGAPLDNNEAERALKRVVLSRKNSLFYQTQHGAAVGDIVQSLIETCRLNGINAWEYLVMIISKRGQARKNPHLFLPWNYKGEEVELWAA